MCDSYFASLVEIRKEQPLVTVDVTAMTNNELKSTKTKGKSKAEVLLNKVLFASLGHGTGS